MTDTFYTEAAAFLERNRDKLPDTGPLQLGAVAWGFARAILECPDCGPGTYRTPLDPEWTRLVCRGCRGTWEKKLSQTP